MLGIVRAVSVPVQHARREPTRPPARATACRPRHLAVAALWILLGTACAHGPGGARGPRVLYLEVSAGRRAAGPTRAALSGLVARARAHRDEAPVGAAEVRAALPADIRWPRVISPPLVGWLEQVTARGGDPWAPPQGDADRAALRQAARSLSEVDLTSSDAPRLRQRLLDVGLFGALAAFYLNGPDEARRQLEALAATFGPEATPTPGAFPPLAVALYEDARRAVAGTPGASLLVRSTPAAATIYVNGRRSSARTPARFDRLRAGPVEIQVALGGQRSLRHRVYLEPGPNVLRIDLGFEGAVRLETRWVGLHYPCWETFQARFAADAAKLGRWVHAARVVGVLGQPQPGGALLSAYELSLATGALVRRQLSL